MVVFKDLSKANKILNILAFRIIQPKLNNVRLMIFDTFRIIYTGLYRKNLHRLVEWSTSRCDYWIC